MERDNRKIVDAAGENFLIDSGVRLRETKQPARSEVSGAFFWLCAFFFVYCARPEDWIPGLSYIPLAKITSIFALLAMLSSLGRTRRGFRDVPPEGFCLFFLVALLVPSALLSPVWKGGALNHTVDFAKVAVAWILIFLLVTNFDRLKKIFFVQAASVAVIAIVSVVKGHSAPRLEGVLGGIYSNPNDLAFAIVLSLPFCLAFLLQARGLPKKALWLASILVMATALFLTASRAGFIDLVIAGSVCLWHFAIKGKRLKLLVATAVVGVVLLAVAGGRLKDRFFAISGDINSSLDQSAYGSYEERQALMVTALKGMLHYPIFGVGVHNFVTYSGRWKEVHNSYLQMGVEGGVPALGLYLAFFWYGFRNLKRLRKRRDLDAQTVLLAGALHSSLIGFVVGAFFSPEAYQFFPYFAVAQTSALWAIIREQESETNRPAKLSSVSGGHWADQGRQTVPPAPVSR